MGLFSKRIEKQIASYHALKDEVKEVEQIRRNVYSILMEEHPTRTHEHAR